MDEAALLQRRELVEPGEDEDAPPSSRAGRGHLRRHQAEAGEAASAPPRRRARRRPRRGNSRRRRAPTRPSNRSVAALSLERGEKQDRRRGARQHHADHHHASTSARAERTRAKQPRRGWARRSFPACPPCPACPWASAGVHGRHLRREMEEIEPGDGEQGERGLPARPAGRASATPPASTAIAAAQRMMPFGPRCSVGEMRVAAGPVELDTAPVALPVPLAYSASAYSKPCGSDDPGAVRVAGHRVADRLGARLDDARRRRIVPSAPPCSVSNSIGLKSGSWNVSTIAATDAEDRREGLGLLAAQDLQQRVALLRRGALVDDGLAPRRGPHGWRRARRTCRRPSGRPAHVAEMPLSMRIATAARQLPFVGRALNWQGQPQSQLQVVISGPLMLQSTKAMTPSVAISPKRHAISAIV